MSRMGDLFYRLRYEQDTITEEEWAIIRAMSEERATAPASTSNRRQALADRAIAKSAEQAQLGNLPRLIRQDDAASVWSVGSRTTGGQIYLVTVTSANGAHCECPAGIVCWHITHVIRAIAGDIPHYTDRVGLPTRDIHP